MPMLTTDLIFSPVCPVQSPERTLSAKSDVRCNTP